MVRSVSRIMPSCVGALTVAIALGQSLASAAAGPCTQDIAQIEQAARAANGPDSGPTAPQSTNAQLHRQPTPGSIRQAEDQTSAAFSAALASAKEFDAQGKRAECQSKVDELKRMLVLQ
jgi:hypothetical protein